MSFHMSREPKWLLFGAAFVALGAVALKMPANADSSQRTAPHRFNTGSYSDSTSSGPVLGADNTGSSNPFNLYGVEGKVDSDVGGVGVLGYGGGAKSYGAYGVTFGTNGIGVYGAGDGPTPAPDATPSSTQQSTGVVGDSHSGSGVYGSTEFPNSSNVSLNPIGGVTGVDGDGKHDNAGVLGITTGGGYGVEGNSGNGADGGVLGLATTGDGVYADSYSGAGVAAISNSGPAISATSTSGNGLIAQSTSAEGIVGGSTSAAGVGGTSSTSSGVSGTSGSGDGVDGASTSGIGVSGVTLSNSAKAGVYGAAGNGYGVWGLSDGTGDAVLADATSTGQALHAVAANNGYGTQLVNTGSGGSGLEVEGETYGIIDRVAGGTGNLGLLITDMNGTSLFEVDGDGNLKVHGTTTTFSRTRSGHVAQTYTARASAPTIDDVGTGQLQSGVAQVRLDPALIEQMDRSVAYHVFLTPDADTRGLYVALKTPAGFVVRETQGGRGSFAFDYRIVASVDGQAGRRMSIAANDPPVRSIRSNGRSLLPRPVIAAHPKFAARQMTAKRASLLRMLQQHVSPANFYRPERNVGVESARR